MKFKKILIFTGLILYIVGANTIIATSPFGTCDPELGKKIASESPTQIFQRLTRSYIPVFAKDSYTKETIDEKEFIGFINMMACLYEWIDQQKKVNPAYKDYMIQFYTTAGLIYGTAKTLKNNLQQQTPQQLQAIKKLIENKLTTIRNISTISLNAIESSTKPSSAWEKTVGSNLETIFPNYKSFFQSYENGKKSKKEPMSDTEFKTFLNLNSINPTKNELENLINLLERFTYRIKKNLFSRNTDLKNASQEIIDRIKKQYPNFKFVTETLSDKISTTKDKASLIIFALADQFEGSLQKLLNEITSLIK